MKHAAGIIVFIGVIGVLFFSTLNSKVYHVHLGDFFKNKIYKDAKEVVLYGYLDPLQVIKSDKKISFILYPDEKRNQKINSIQVYLNGIIPDSADLFGKIAVYGFYNSKEKIFYSHKVLAKCSSKYEEMENPK